MAFTRSLSIDARKLIADLGGATRVVSIVDGHAGVCLKRKTVEKWDERGRIPADKLMLILVSALVAGYAINLLDYLKMEPAR